MTKARKTSGVLFGILLFFVWLFFLTKVEFFFFSEKEVLHGTEVIGVKIPEQYLQLIIWLTAGLLPFFLIAGHYLLNSNTISGVEKTRDITAMKSILIGFFIWLLFTVIITIFKMDLNNRINMAGGFLTILVVYLLIKK